MKEGKEEKKDGRRADSAKVLESIMCWYAQNSAEYEALGVAVAALKGLDAEERRRQGAE